MKPEDFQKLPELFEAVIGQAPEARNAYIDSLELESPLLRQELRALVESHREDDLLGASPLIDDPSDPLRPGQSIVHYQIQREIGRGGMGVVYLARDTRLHRDVALKALSPHLLSDAKQQERFRREARAAASISHPGVATIYALEEVGGHFYIISEYVPGENLTTRTRGVRLPLAEVLQVALKIGEGLASAHDKGVVHRDLKPNNVICTREGHPKIIDFGLARIPGADPIEQRLTDTGQLLGSPAYMSPEQLQGDNVDFRTDIFSFGILLYELVSGTHPFEGRTPAAMTAAILRNEPLSLTGLAPGLAAFISRCLQKFPSNRYTSTGQFLRDLGEVTGAPGAEGTVASAKPGELHSQWWTFHQAAVVLLYGVMIAVLWGVKDVAGPSLALFFGVLASAIANATLRIHLLFTSRFNPGALASQMSRASAWIHRIDWAFTGFILVTALTILNEVPLIGGVLVAVAVGYLVVFLMIEPATTSAVFRSSDSDT